MIRRLMVVVALAAAVSRAVSAQRLGPVEERPRLRDVTDTNDAHAYYNFGLEKFERDPQTAAAAFYWAARINPGWAEPLYARRAALLMKDKRMMARVMEGDRGTLESPEVRRLDSLQFRALMLAPFLYRRFDRPMFMAYIRDWVTHQSRIGGGEEPNSAEMDFYIQAYLTKAGPASRARAAYANGDFRNALEHYARALDAAKVKAYLRFERARIFGMRSESDSAIAELNLALEELRTQDQKDLIVFYDSKALAEYSIGVLREGAGSADSAREAYGRALQEDLSYYPAHMRLGLLALGKHDTTTAVSELALAAQLAPDEPHIRYVNGYVLAAARRYPESVTELRKAAELEPMYALPYLRLGQVYEILEKGPESLAAYQAFLAHARRNDTQREFATERITELKELLALTPALATPAPAASTQGPVKP
jgi:tetratricopeptide (TPR) repeat protein